MPRAKVQKKESASKLPATNGNDASPSTTTEGNDEVGVAIKQPTKRQVRGKKADAKASEEVNAAQELKAVVKQTGKKETLSATKDNEASTSTGVKSKARVKKTPAPAPDPQISEVVVKKTAGRGKRKPSEEHVEPKRRAKKQSTEIAETTNSAELGLGNSRNKKEKSAEVQDEHISAPPKDAEPKVRATKTKPEQIDVNTVGSLKTRAKKEVKGSSTATTRGRGTKRLADTEISQMLEAEEESELLDSKVKPASKKSAKQMKITDENVEVPIKKRGRKAATKESQSLQNEEVPAPSKKRAPKRVNDNQNLDLVASAPVSKLARGRKRAKPDAVDNGDDEGCDLAVGDADGSTSTLVDPGCRLAVLKSLQNVFNFCFPASNTKKTAIVKADTPAAGSYDKSLFPLPTDKVFNLKISSWNVAGLRAWLKKDGLKFVDVEEPDVFCLQETKCVNDQLPDEMTRLPGYHPYWLCMPGGYAGVAIYSKIMPINVEYGIGNEEFDDVGRMITAEYEKFYLINVYVPNSGRKLVNLESRMRWEPLFQAHVQKLDALKPVVICGDMNVSHLEIDLANPKANTRNAGYTKEEREKMTELLALGYVDTFRHLYPNRTGAYSFWTYMANARARNVGWRLDYCIVSQRIVSRVVDNVMRTHCLGSDHCPITVFLNM